MTDEEDFEIRRRAIARFEEKYADYIRGLQHRYNSNYDTALIMALEEQQATYLDMYRIEANLF